MHAGLVGLGLGFLVSLQIGPMSLFLIRTTLSAGLMAGAAVAAGIALVDGLYAAAGAAGAAPLLDIAPLRFALGLTGACVLIWLGARTIVTALRVRAAAEMAFDVARPRRAFLTSLAGTASNPLTIVSWATIFAAASTAGAARTTPEAALLTAGVAVGSFAWCATLAAGIAVGRRTLGPPALRFANLAAGAGMAAFGVRLFVGTTHDA
jgi:putative LysE/RhtB family amino acid efflux pump